MHGVMGQCMFMHAMTRMHGGVWLVWWIWHKITEPILRQHNYPKSSLVRSVLVQLVLNGRKNRIQLSQLEDNSELVVAVEVVVRRACPWLA